jgi:glycosyltransferase involved in cell wall biosynthesis
MTRILVTIPTFNEARRIGPCLTALEASLDPTKYALAVAEDGSTDGSRELLEKLKIRHPGLIVSSCRERLGRGTALRRLWSNHPADVYCYVDADLPAGEESVRQVAERIVSGADISVGSRYCVRAKVRRPPVVKFASQTFNWVVRWSFSDGVSDHQCGLKAFSERAFRTLDGMVADGGWFWDTEMLVLGRRLGMRIDEVPLNWAEHRYARSNLRRLAIEMPYFLGNTVRLRSSVRGVRYGGPIETRPPNEQRQSGRQLG